MPGIIQSLCNEIKAGDVGDVRLEDEINVVGTNTLCCAGIEPLKVGEVGELFKFWDVAGAAFGYLIPGAEVSVKDDCS